MRKVLSGFMAYVLLAFSSLAYGSEVVTQGTGNTSTQAWKVYTVAPPSGSSSSARATSAPTVTSTPLASNATPCTAASGASCTIILASTEVIAWTNISLTIRNADAADAITNVLVEFSPDNTNWEVWDATTFAGLAAATILSMGIASNSRRYIRVEARAAGTVDNAVVNLTMNDG